VRTALRLVAALVLLVIVAVLVAPAGWLDRVLAARSDQRLRLLDAQGLWWNGSGEVATAHGEARLPIAWRVSLAPLFRGALVVDLAPRGGDDSPSGHVRVQRGAIDVSSLHVRAPAAVAFAFVPTAKALAWGGEIALQSPAFAWHDHRASGTLDARWNGARVVAGTLAVDLGTVTVASAPGATDPAHALAAVVGNAGGDVAIDGTITDRNGVVEVALSLAPTATAPEAIRQLLPLIGARDAGGHAQIRWRSDR
jgi:hypothetical protein